DVKNRWGARWVEWRGYGPFFSAVVHAIERQRSRPAGLEVTPGPIRGTTRAAAIAVEARDGAGNYRDLLHPIVQVRSGAGATREVRGARCAVRDARCEVRGAVSGSRSRLAHVTATHTGTEGGGMDEKSLFTGFWIKESETTSKVLARIPDGSDYRPDPKSRT